MFEIGDLVQLCNVDDSMSGSLLWNMQGTIGYIKSIGNDTFGDYYYLDITELHVKNSRMYYCPDGNARWRTNCMRLLRKNNIDNITDSDFQNIMEL